MTLNGFLRSLGRRWYVLAVFAALTALGGFLAVKASGVYWTRVTVVLLAPASLDNQNTLRSPTESLIDFAAVLERQVNGNHAQPRFSFSSATLYGAGVRDGYKVSLQNDGGQWSDSFTQPVLDVEVVSPTKGGAETRLREVIDRIDTLVQSRQVDASVPSNQMITTLQSPSPASVSHIGGSRVRALGAVALVGAISGIAVTLLFDRRMLARAARRSASTPGG
ncbi:hypothetical protein ACVXZ4_16940 [Lacisediminihabitans sp. FW035]